jgi:hypothetical protein
VLAATYNKLYQFSDESDLSSIFAKYRRSHLDKSKLAEKHAISLDEDLDDANGCSRILLSYTNTGKPFGLGWQNQRFLCWIKLSASSQLYKRKQFAIIKYKKKEGDSLNDSVQPVACHLTQFHALFVYEHSITVVSLITQQVVYNTHSMQATFRNISFDIDSQNLLLVATTTPVMVSRL